MEHMVKHLSKVFQISPEANFRGCLNAIGRFWQCDRDKLLRGYAQEHFPGYVINAVRDTIHDGIFLVDSEAKHPNRRYAVHHASIIREGIQLDKSMSFETEKAARAYFKRETGIE